MKTLFLSLLMTLLAAAQALADVPPPAPRGSELNWTRHLLSLEHGIVGTLIYTLLGILLLALAFKMKDLLLPGSLSEQLVKDRNMAIAVVTAAYLIGISIIIAAAITG